MFSGDGVLEVADGVLGLDFDHLLLDELEVVLDARHLCGVLGGDVGVAQEHQVIDVVAGVEEEAPHRRVRNLVVDEGYRTQVQAHELLDVFHLLVQGHHQVLENLRNHLGTNDFVTVEGPAGPGLEALGRGLADVVQQRGPAEPQVRLGADALHEAVAVELGCVVAEPARGNAFGLGRGDVVKHRERVREVLLVAPAVDRLDALEGRELREHVLQQPGLVHQPEGDRRPGRDEHLVELFGDALLGKDREPVAHAPHGPERLGDDLELLLRRGKLGREADGPQHAERIVGVGGVGLEGSADDARGEVPDAPEGVYELAEAVFLQAEGHCVDGEIAPQLVVLERPVLHDRLARLSAVGLLAGAHELYFVAAVAHHRRTEILEIRDILARRLANGFGEIDAAALDHYVDVVTGPAKETVTYVTADHEGFYASLGGHFRDYRKDRLVEESCGYCRHWASISS